MEFANTNKSSIPSVITTVKVSPEFHSLCKMHNIKFSEATRVGISVLLAEAGVQEYDNNLTLVRRMEQMRIKLEEMSQKYYELLDKMNQKKLE